MKLKAKYCIDCGCEGTVGRKRCNDCLIIYNRDRIKKHYKKLVDSGGVRNRYGKIKCCICNGDMIKNTPNQIAHGKCKRKYSLEYNSYPRDENGMMFGRRVIIDLGIKFSKGMIVHHIDENPINNSYKNLMIMSNSNHGKIHSFLSEQWLINKSIYGDRIGKVWKQILIKLNFVWINNKKINIVKIDNRSDFTNFNMLNENIYVIE